MQKCDLSKFSKQEINNLIFRISTRFEGVCNYDKSSTIKDSVVDLCDGNKKWGEYNENNNSLYIVAWDSVSCLPVEMYLFDNHFEIPVFKSSSIKWGTKEDVKRYTKAINEILNDKKETSVDKIEYKPF